MIIKNFETQKIILNKNSFILLYGKNEGLKAQIKNELLKGRIITSNYDEQEIIDNAHNFIETIYTKQQIFQGFPRFFGFSQQSWCSVRIWVVEPHFVNGGAQQALSERDLERTV